MSINHREFVKTASAAKMGQLVGTALSETKPASKRPAIGKQAIADRMAFGDWINDVPTEPLPFGFWPPVILDAIAEQSIVRTLDLPAQSGSNRFHLFGLFAAWVWPVDMRTDWQPVSITFARSKTRWRLPGACSD
jgi:hypothetical protein